MKSLKSSLAILASLGLLFAVGCDGSLTTPDDPGPGPDIGPNPTPGPGETQGRAIFDRDILPLVSGCSGDACHSGAGTDPLKFLGGGAEADFYTTIVQLAQIHGDWNTDNAALITKLTISAQAGGNHFGFAPYSLEQIALLANWFQVEKDERLNGDPNIPTTSTRDLLAEWSACMTIDNWNLAAMGEWAAKGTSSGACANCHNGGEYWISVNSNNETMFEMNRYELFITGFFAVDVAGGQVVPAYDKLVRMGQGNPNGDPHPTYNTDVDNDLNFSSLTAFYELTNAAKLAGNCPPAGFPQVGGQEPPGQL